ncbi:hypothetical protein EUGRSUZ_J01017 [Eucalyptus grandis]|uniref:Uncharacterized protein n=2 Tax=Eucalyptus grandis TaxID=71139 RepID=A0ACC3J582_EUCGR|nr:hypothetical protein EUGRSUZ_J01017 [Eucalyptus grandis]
MNEETRARNEEKTAASAHGQMSEVNSRGIRRRREWDSISSSAHRSGRALDGRRRAVGASGTNQRPGAAQ